MVSPPRFNGADHETVSLPSPGRALSPVGPEIGVAFATADGEEETPPAVVPTTVNEYSMPAESPVIVQLNAVVTQVKVPAVTVKLTAGVFAMSTDHAIVADCRPPTADVITGVAGVGRSGVMASEFGDCAP
jgi:hypothetical protein